VWKLAGAPERLTIDLDATLIASHSEKECAAGTFKGGYGFHPILAYADETGEALAGELRPGNAGANAATDQIRVAEQAIAQIPVEHIEAIELLLRRLRGRQPRTAGVLPRRTDPLLGRLRPDRDGARRDPQNR
jgi:hypothetical protein